jgi:hypothetical protein
MSSTLTVPETTRQAPPAPPRRRKQPPASEPRPLLSRLADWTRTPPGRLARLLTALLLACAALLASAVWTAVSHSSAADRVAVQDNRLALDAQRIHRSLADADATSANAYLAGGVEPADLRRRYLDDLAQAQTALRDATVRAGSDRATATALDPLTTQISVYSGLVDTATADNRQGLPVGGAYLGEAATLMRTKLLPAAQRLYGLETSRLRNDQDRAGSFPYPLAVIVVITLALLAYAQRRLSRETKRTFNAGLLASTAAVAVLALWSLVSFTLQASAVGISRDQGSAQLAALDRAQSDALRAHSDEGLFLISGGEDTSFSDDYTTTIHDMDHQLSAAATFQTDAGPRVTTAQAASTAWQRADQVMMLSDQTGHFNDAVASAIDPKAQGTATRFTAVQGALNDAITTDQRSFEEHAADARDDVALLAPGLGVLAVLAGAGCAVGLGVRMREYR